jgi:hypothetical protein
MVQVWAVTVVPSSAIGIRRPGIGPEIIAPYYSIAAIVNPDVFTVINIDIYIAFAVIDV